MKFTDIFFDLDGTLTDPYEGITRSVEYALNKFGIEIDTREKLKCFIGPPLTDAFCEYYGMSTEEAQKAVCYYRERFSTLGLFENEVYPEIPDLLLQLKRGGFRLSVATSKPEVFSKRILDKFELSQYFDFLSGSELSGKRVNKDEVIEYAISNLKIKDRSKILMVGDRMHDILGAKKCGISSVGVLWGYGDRNEHENVKADFIAENIYELKNYIFSGNVK